MSRLSELLQELRTKEPALARDLEREVSALSDRRAFGLNFERHVPEAVELPGRKVRKGDKVRILPPRGQMPKKSDEKLWQVIGIDRTARVAKLESVDAQVEDAVQPSVDPHYAQHETRTASLDDLVVVAEFRDPIYPGLISSGKVERGGNKPFHTVINAENFHALETLLFTHRGKVDCIYIDPPYNTRDNDWKYNNDYVNSDDLYRHSKWLAFMERRLLLAKELLNPDDSALIVTIDEKEYLRLGLLLEQAFPECRIQMVTALTNPKGVARGQEFYRVDEYLFVVYIGRAAVSKGTDPMILTGKRNVANEDQADDVGSAGKKDVRWGNLLRSGTDARRTDRKHQFYPIFLNAQDGSLHSVGEALLPPTAPRTAVRPPTGTIAVWPIRKDGSEGRWQVGSQRLRELFDLGFASIGKFTGSERVSFSYVTENLQSQIAAGVVAVVGRDADGVAILEFADDIDVTTNPKTMWNKQSHSASEYGSTLLRAILPQRGFPFPKSLYAVEDTLRFFVSSKPAAVIVDFFCGSGTTAHAVMRLNKQDGGRRQTIMVTNNEIAAEERKSLREQGLRPGDRDWERWGICEYIAKPRIESVITGKTPDGQPIKGNYKFVDEFSMSDGFEENAEFFTLTYEAPLRVSSNREFARIAPLLWMRAGSRGRRIEDISKGWDVADAYGVLANLDCTQDFLKAIVANEAVAIAFIVTDEERLFESVAQALPDHIEPVRLYEAYLRNFEIESGRGSL
jgi:adenine-specific DNA-methyltransferase